MDRLSAFMAPGGHLATGGAKPKAPVPRMRAAENFPGGLFARFEIA